MRRITVEDVRAAYAKTGIKPARQCYSLIVNDEWCGCPLIALVAADLPPNEFNELSECTRLMSEGKRASACPQRTSFIDWIHSRRGREDYTVGFMSAIDSNSPDAKEYLRQRLDDRPAAWHEGFADGVAVRKEFFPEAVPA